MYTLERYTHRHSLIHRLDPRAKVVMGLAFIIATVLLPDGAWGAFGASWLLLLAAAHMSQLALAYLLGRSFIVIPFLLAATSVIFTLPGPPLANWHIAGYELTITIPGLIRFVSIVLRSWLAVQAAILLTATTRFPDLMHALHHLRVPPILVAIISFMYRYLFVLTDEAGRLLRARAARSARSDDRSHGGSLWWRARTTGSMIGQLLLRSLERSERVYGAMLARGYQGQMLTMNPHVMQGRDWTAVLTAVFLLLLVQLLARLV